MDFFFDKLICINKKALNQVTHPLFTWGIQTITPDLNYSHNQQKNAQANCTPNTSEIRCAIDNVSTDLSTPLYC